MNSGETVCRRRIITTPSIAASARRSAAQTPISSTPGWRCFEDRNPAAEGGDAAIAQYVWGIYLDELLQITTLVPITTGSGETAKTYDAGTYYALQDLLYRTTATVTINEESAVIQEAYDFDAYGNTLIFNARRHRRQLVGRQRPPGPQLPLPVPLHRPALRCRDGACTITSGAITRRRWADF